MPHLASFRIGCERVADAAGKVGEIAGVVGEQSFTFVRFLQEPPGSGELTEYLGEYESRELGVTFLVESDGQRLIVKNQGRHFCAMDLVVAQTIRDSFIAHDPNPETSQITFLRKEGVIEVFVFRDYDGAGREYFRSVKVNGQTHGNSMGEKRNK